MLCALLVSACGGTRVVSGPGELPAPPPGVGFLRISVEPATAELLVDGRFMGQVDGYAEGVVRLPAGPHRVELRKRGFEAWYGLVATGETAVEVRTHLVAEVR